MFSLQLLFLFLCIIADLAQGIPAPDDAPEPDSAELRCATQGYKLYRSGGCYKLHRRPLLNWQDANSTCVAEGGFLAVIKDGEEAEVVKEVALDSGFSSKWIGLRLTADGWRSVHGDRLEDIFHQFANEELQCACAALVTDGTLLDLPCKFKKQFICEKQI